MDRSALRAQLVRLIVAAGDGTVTESDLVQAGGSLRALNYTSLSFMRLIDAIENELGVYVDPEADPERFATIDTLADLVHESGETVDA
jgi:acyl carrier protein